MKIPTENFSMKAVFSTQSKESYSAKISYCENSHIRKLTFILVY